MQPLAVVIKLFFFFNDTATTEIYTLSLHDALPILQPERGPDGDDGDGGCQRKAPASCRLVPLRLRCRGRFGRRRIGRTFPDRKSTRLNSSHANISYAAFCLEQKKKEEASLHSHVEH